ncbi:MAG TPA: helix-turn-helix domain-containing protein [Acidimicrobiales bacterium]
MEDDDGENRTRRRGPRRPEGAPAGPDEVRRAVLDAAAALFTTRGVGAVSLRDIATEANIQVALIRRYIGTREELIDAVMADLSNQVVTGVTERPLEQQSFDPDSFVGRWTRLLVYFAITGRDLSTVADVNPARALAQVAADAYGLDDEAARVRGAQILASALGWRLLEPYLLKAGGLEDIPIQDLHDALTELHRTIGAMSWERPSTPPS